MTDKLATLIKSYFGDKVQSHVNINGEVTIEVERSYLREVCLALRDHDDFKFNQLIDICGVDYLQYGVAEWKTEEATATGYSRGVDRGQNEKNIEWEKPRFAVVYHLLSISHNVRLRLRSFVDDNAPQIDSVIDIWPAADWFEREAFDLFGILFNGHPDLRRILTDYGFIGHPFRKDFPLIGNVELRYDAEQQRCVYEPVSIQARTLVPKTIRRDNRYAAPAKIEEAKNG